MMLLLFLMEQSVHDDRMGKSLAGSDGNAVQRIFSDLCPNVCIRLDNVGQSLQKSTPTRQENAFTKDIRRKLRRRLFENGTDA